MDWQAREQLPQSRSFAWSSINTQSHELGLLRARAGTEPPCNRL